MVQLPAAVARSARSLGGAAAAWVDELPAIVAELCAAWDVRLGRTLEGGNSSYVAEAETGNGGSAILKITMPGDEPVAGEIAALSIADGQGYARRLAADLARRAMLVERLGPRLAQSGVPAERQTDILVETLRTSWRRLASQAGLTPVLEKAAWLSRFIPAAWAELGQPCSEAVVRHAVAFAQARAEAFDPQCAVLLHGDPHAHNALADPLSPGRYRLIDPDGLWGEPAYDLGVLMRGGSQDLLDGDPIALGRARAARLADQTGQPQEAIWAWAVVERVSTALYAMKLGLDAEGRRMLAVSEAWAVSHA